MLATFFTGIYFYKVDFFIGKLYSTRINRNIVQNEKNSVESKIINRKISLIELKQSKERQQK